MEPDACQARLGLATYTASIDYRDAIAMAPAGTVRLRRPSSRNWTNAPRLPISTNSAENLQMSSLPPDLQKLLDEINSADRDGVALAATSSEEQFFWQPDRGEGRRGWSIAQCLDHL